MKALFIRPKDIKSLAIFRRDGFTILRIGMEDGNMEWAKVPEGDEARLKDLKTVYDLLKESVYKNGDFVEAFSLED
jgi:hypothetical protein